MKTIFKFELTYSKGEKVVVDVENATDLDEAVESLRTMKIPDEPEGEPEIFLVSPHKEWIKY